MAKDDLQDFWNARFDRIEAKTDKLIEGQSALLVQVSQNTVVLTEHQRRSLAVEEALALAKAEADAKILAAKQEAESKILAAKQEVDLKLSALATKVEPLTFRHNFWASVGKGIVFLGVVLGIAFTASKFIGLLP